MSIGNNRYFKICLKTGVMKRLISNIFLISVLSGNFIFSQDEDKPGNLALNGYITNMQSVTYENLSDLWLTENLLHNRLNFNWYISDKLTFSLQLRNRFIYGDMIRLDQLLKEVDDQMDGDSVSGFPSILGIDPDNLNSGMSGYGNYVDNINSDNGIVDLSFNIAEGKTYLINFFLDRMWLQYTSGNLEIKAGRQRINWGQTFAWYNFRV